MVDISPEANIFSIFRKISYKSWYALAEFVDNSVSSWENWDSKYPIQDRPRKLKVEIDINSGGPNPHIEIRDNASGIAWDDFERAFKVASLPPDRTGLNEFGMGMKTAGFWFANRWSVRTSAFGESTTRTMKFDLAKILAEQTKSIEPELGPGMPTQHFTTIRLENLNQIPKGLSVTKIKNHLTGIYREFIRQGHLELVVNGEILKFDEPAILRAKHAGVDTSEEIIWRKNIEFAMPSGRRVKGFAAIREAGNTALAGFALFRKSRLIEGSFDEPFRPFEIFGQGNKYASQRLIGEFHLEGFEVTHTKDAIQWADGELEDFVSKVKAQLSSEPINVLRQVDKYRKSEKPGPEIIQAALRNLREFMTPGLSKSVEILEPRSADLEVSIPETILVSDGETVSTELKFETLNHGNWIVNVVGHTDVSKTDFFEVGVNNKITDESGIQVNIVEVQVNLAHPFSSQYLGANLENAEVILAFASALAVSLAIGKSVGAKSNFIVSYLNELVKFSK